MRNLNNIYPDFTAEIDAINENGISPEILYKILEKHQPNAKYNKELYYRYQAIDEHVPIFERKARFEDDEAAVNNKINNDFFSEIIDFKTGYFAGKPIAYSYGSGEEAEQVTGGEVAVDIASKVVTDFVVRNNLYDVDLQTTKYAAICGYAGRLFYIDEDDGNERVMPVPPYQTIILSNTSITEPIYAVRYFDVKDIDDNVIYKAEFYDNTNIYYFEGGSLSELVLIETKPHLFDYCPLQGIPNNEELIGDAEKVLNLIDAYDRALSDSNNEIESFANAYMVYENVNATDEEIKKAQKTGAIKFYSGASNGKVYFLTKDVNDTFTENHLNRLEDNIYRFSKTPNLNDEAYGNASGISLKFKLTGLETKCGMFQAKMQSAGTYMFKLLASSWNKKKIEVDPLQCVMDFKRNFPLDILSEARAAQALIAAGVPKQIAFTAALSFIDDIDYVMQLIEEEQNSIPSLTADLENAFADEETDEEDEETEEDK